MNKELDKELCKKYPKIFAQRNMPMNQTAMCWGFQHGDGWYTLVDSLCFLIQAHIDHINDPKKCSQVVASTVKEKFGGLRFYTSGGDKVTESYIRFASFLSNSTCEMCGTTAGVEQTEGWIYTMCKPCLKKFKNDQKKGATFYRVKWFFYTLKSKLIKLFKGK